MRLRAPSYPLITIDPYFSIWSPADRPTDTDTTHWTGKPITLSVVANVDGNDYRLIGKCDADTIPAANMIAVDCNAFSTIYTYSINGAKITLKFTSPIIPDDLYMLSRPISYLEVTKESFDSRRHTVSVKVEMSEEICMNLKGDSEVEIEKLELGKYYCIKMGIKDQKFLKSNGDDLRIEW